MLKCSHLTLTLPDGRILLSDLSFSVQDKDHLALVGEEGDGKSTLLKIIAGETPDYVRITGSFYTDWKMGYLPQQIPACWKDQTPLDYLLKEHPEEEIDPAAWSLCGQMEEAARKTGLRAELLYEERSVSSFSGGEKVRLALTKVLLGQPDCFLLDEPANDLDLDALLWLENWIVNSDKPILFIPHDIRLLECCAERILHLELRNKKTKPVWTLFTGSWKEYLSRRKANREKEFQVAASEKREYAKQKQRLNDLANKVEHSLRTVSRQAPHKGQVLKKKMKAVRSSQQALEEQSYSRTDSVEEAAGFLLPHTTFPAGKKLIDEPLEITMDERVLIEPFVLSLYGPVRMVFTGANGCGKTTLLKDLFSRLQDRKDLKAGWMPQDYDSAFKADDTPVSFLLRICPDLSLVQTRLGSMRFLASEMNQSVFKCSGGQKAKLILASLALQKCNVLLLDEPTRNLSALSVGVLCEALQDSPAAILAVSHDRAFMEALFIEKGVIENRRFHIEPILPTEQK